MKQSINNSISPFKIQQLVDLIVDKKRLSTEDAFYYLYSSDLYKKLTDEETFLWQESTLSLYELLKKEKSATRKEQNKHSKTTLFYAFCLEGYKLSRKISANETLCLFLEYNIFSFLEDTYETLHTQGKDYILTEIDRYIERKKEEA